MSVAPMDINEIALLLGRKDIEILQLQYQVTNLNAELAKLSQQGTGKVDSGQLKEVSGGTAGN